MKWKAKILDKKIMQDPITSDWFFGDSVVEQKIFNEQHEAISYLINSYREETITAEVFDFRQLMKVATLTDIVATKMLIDDGGFDAYGMHYRLEEVSR